MVDGEVLRDGEVEARFDAGAAQVRRHVRPRLDGVDRHRARLVIGALEGIGHAHGEDRQIVEEEGVEVVGVVHHDEVGPHRLELARHVGEEARSLALRPLALDQRGEERRMRHTQCPHDLCHLCAPFSHRDCRPRESGDP
jgi:hypothetical protein